MTLQPTLHLGILWGHISPGIIRLSRPICSRYEGPAPFTLARSNATGKKCYSWFNSLGHYHINAGPGPQPVSLVEMLSANTSFVSSDVSLRLHAIAIGYPIVGDNLYTEHEKYYNPVIRIPQYPGTPLLQLWLNAGKMVLNSDNLTSQLIDFHGLVEFDKSKLYGLDVSEELGFNFQGENSPCQWADHPSSVTVRRDRGKVHS